MPRLWQKTWLRVLTVTILILLQLLFLFIMLRLDAAPRLEEISYYAAAVMSRDSPGVLDEEAVLSTFDPALNTAENAALWGIPPLYPQLLRLAVRYLSGRNVNPLMIPRLLNLALFLPAWAALYFIAKRLTGDRMTAFLPPLVYGFSPAALLVLRTTGPYMLCTAAAAITVAALLRIALKARARLPYGVLCLASLAGFLALYAYTAFLICAVAAAVIYVLFRYRRSPAVTMPILAAAGVLIAVILYPASLDHLAAKAAPFASPWLNRLTDYYTALSGMLFGGHLSWALVFCALAGLVMLYIRLARPKTFHAPVKTEEDEAPEVEQDPAAAAYRRRIARRAELPADNRAPAGAAAAFLIVGSTAVFYLLALTLVHYVPISPVYGTEGWSGTSVPQAALLYWLCPLLTLWISAWCLQFLRRIGCRPAAVVILTAGLCLAVTIIVWARSGLLTAAEWLTLFT